MRKLLIAITTILTLLTSTSVFAQETQKEIILQHISGYDNSIYIANSDESNSVIEHYNLLPNYITLSAKKSSADNINIFITNYGLDTVDYVSYNIKAYNIFGQEIHNSNVVETNLFPNFPRKNAFYLRAWSTIYITSVYVRDGTQSVMGSNLTINASDFN